MDVKNDLGGGKPTLLIAEDEESNYLLLKTILHKYCNLIRAKTGLEALALFKENEVDLILMDIKMPEMTGIESLKEIRKLSKDIPVIMQSLMYSTLIWKPLKKPGLLVLSRSRSI